MPLLLLLLVCQTAPSDEPVRLDFPDEVELKAVIDAVAATLRLNVLYDEAVVGKKVSLRIHQPVPKNALLDLLRSVLRSRGLALVPTEPAGWWKIVPSDKFASEAGPPRRELPPIAGQDNDVLTYALPARHADLAKLQAVLTPYLSKPGGTLQPLPESRLLVITDYARNVRQMAQLAALLDVATPATTLETLPVKHQEPAELAALLTRLLTEQARLEAPAALAATAPVSLQPDPVGGGLLVLGPPAQIERARELLARFDVPTARRTELYQPKHLTASRLRALVEQLIGTLGSKLAADDATNTLFVTARPEEHRRIAALLERFDRPPSAAATPLRFYTLLNRRADDVFATLALLLGGQATAENGPGASSSGRPGPASQPIGLPAAATGAADPAAAGRPPARNPALRVQGENFSLSLDEHTNTILAVAPPELHQQITQLIERLDKRRPQVLVEVTLVSITVEDGLNLGAELQTHDLGQPWDFELFTSFGLSTINPTTGQRRLTPLPGGTGVLLGPDEVPLILQALASRGNTKVYSAPRILVDDNAVGRIESVAESPFTSVNASNTVATTSFAGFAKAGTQLSIEPHIAQGDHLEIDYTLTVSSFTGSGTATAPPPRSSDTLSSTVRVPDGHTVVVGGLRTETLADASSHVPLAGDVPLLGWLFGSRTHSKSKVRLYAFIRPTVLRNERFDDLKHVSLADLKTAGVPDGWPPTRLQYVTPNGPWRPAEAKPAEEEAVRPGWTPAARP